MAAMEDVLVTYERAYDPHRPVVCLDEKLVTLHAEVTPALPVSPGQPERVDYAYQRVGTANLFVMVEPLGGYRHVAVTAQRTTADYARQLQYLAEVQYPHADRIILVQDNLNTHHLASLYAVFPPDHARRLWERFELHYTPKHASWLNMAELEIGIFQRGCLSRRVPDFDTLKQRVLALETERNAHHATIHWRFTTGNARLKLAHLYPMLSIS